MNQLQRHVIQIKQTRVVPLRQRAERDKRYRLLVTLVRSDRPTMWNFRCINCGRKIVELQNTEVFALDDFYDPQNINNQAIGVHCKNYLSNDTETECPYSYFFRVQ